ncbi:MAG: HAD family hydrolase [Paenibacillus sp. RIFOXYA1_FULL_44_5]|nr:MAG: HAD family hydrolase [Paenibacillus sp. RIFOXYA1_FULL_44_5]
MMQNLFFDLDDTLIHCNKYFHLVLNEFAKLVSKWFEEAALSTAEILQKQSEIDLAAVKKSGLIPAQFPQSLIDTYTFFAHKYGQIPSETNIKMLEELGYSVYQIDAEPYPQMTEALSSLQESGYHLLMYTGGDPTIQKSKIRKVGLERFFANRIYVTQHKTYAHMESILTSGGFDRTRTWMIGNSLRTDIIPALKAGIHAIHLPAELEWSYNIQEVKVKPKGAFFTLSSLSDIPATINRYVADN